MREAQTAAAALHGSVTAVWGHIVGAAGGGPMTPANLHAGSRAANAAMGTVEHHLRTFIANIARWGVQGNYNVQYVAGVQFWSENLATQVLSAARSSEQPGGPPAADVLESIRGTLNFVRDPYNFGTFAELPRHRQ
jgi:hypothetical protein